MFSSFQCYIFNIFYYLNWCCSVIKSKYLLLHHFWQHLYVVNIEYKMKTSMIIWKKCKNKRTSAVYRVICRIRNSPEGIKVYLSNLIRFLCLFVGWLVCVCVDQGQGHHHLYLSQESKQSVMLTWIRGTTVQSCPLIRLYRSAAALWDDPGESTASTLSAHKLKHVSKHTQTPVV